MWRRAFVAIGLGAAAGCGRRGGGPYWRFFTADEARTVDAICAQLIPADGDPGASEARVVNYIDIQLSRPFKKHRQAYRRGIAVVDETSRRMFRKGFMELSAAERLEVLRETEKNSREFFDLILVHVRQGYYGDPRHGGNYQMASWKMVRLPFPQIRGRQHYETPEPR